MTAREQAERLYKKVDTFILSCVDADGYPMTKAVVPGKHRQSLDEMYFCTNTSSRFAGEISKNPKASVYFYKRAIAWKGCFLKGKMEIVTDMALKEAYWDEAYKEAYEKQSFTDPDFCLLRFTPSAGRFYADFTIADFEI